MAKKVVQSIDAVLNLYKQLSETPLQTIERYVKSHPEYKDSKMTYAGRLDPMAEGVLVVLSGEKNKERDVYTGLDKDYEFTFILGIDTDTHDVLGKIVSKKEVSCTKEDVAQALKKYTGKFIQKYPAYSSKVIDGVPLFDIARRGKIDRVVLPEHEVEVKSIELIGMDYVLISDFKEYVRSGIRNVTGDFRQKEILVLWEDFFENFESTTICVFKAKVSCESGFYVRQLVSDVGRDLKTGAVTVSILRTRVGEYSIKDAIR